MLEESLDWSGIYALPSMFRFLVFPRPVSPVRRLKICRFAVNSTRKRGPTPTLCAQREKGGYMAFWVLFQKEVFF